MFNRILNSFFALTICISLASCGGGTTDYAEGGIGGTGISNGAVTDYGSIVVNDVHFDTTGAVVTTDDGNPVTNINDKDIEDLINIGMVVTVKGTINDNGLTGKAETISYDDIVEGPVVSINSTEKSINVLGQTVNVIDGVTKYICDANYVGCSAVNSFTELKADQTIEVSGYIDHKDEITATYIELQEGLYNETETETYEIKGKATEVTGSTDRFRIGGLTVITTFTADTTGLIGKFIKAKGTFKKSTMTLTTTEAVEVDDESFDIADADKAELEGFATTGCTDTTCDFTLSGITVRIDSATVFTSKTGTKSATDIIEGVKLEAEGKLQGGILYAKEIEFK